MDSGYRYLVNGETIKLGDEAYFDGVWSQVSCGAIGNPYALEGHIDNSGVWHDKMRRPIAQDHCATPTDKIVEHALDATSPSNEFDEEREKVFRDAMTTGTGFILSHVPVEDVEQPQEWDGEGFPPAETKCEIMIEDKDWFSGTINYIDYCHCIFTGPTGLHTATYCKTKNMKFRKHLTPEQAEEREREKFCYDAESIFYNVDSISMRQSSQHEIAGAFYDAGYRLTAKGDV